MKQVKIKDICLKGSSNLKQKEVEKSNGKYPVFGANGIVGSINTFHQDKNYIGIIKDGSGIGRVNFYPAKTSVLGTIQYILPKDGYDIKYIGYCLKSLDLSKYKQGAAIPHIYFRDYGERVIRIEDDIEKQQYIVSYLDSAFAEIDAIAKNAEDSLNEARALFQAKLKEMLEKKDGWEMKKLEEIGLTQTGTTPSKSINAYYGDYIPFIRPSEIDFDGMGNINYDSNLKLSEEGLQKGRLFKAGSILMVCIGATISKVGFCLKDVSCNQQINVIKPNNKYNFKFIYYAMTEPTFKATVIKNGLSAQATLPIINKTKWEQLTIAIPPKNIQDEIVYKLDNINQSIHNLSSNYARILTECDALKQSILRKTFE